jgi:predicted transcriptional regulator
MNEETQPLNRAHEGLTSSSGPFRLESEMFTALPSAWLSVLGIPSSAIVSVLREPTIVGVIPDVLISLWGEADVHTPKRPHSYLEAYLLALIEQRAGLSQAEILSDLHLTESAAARALHRLVASGSVLQDREGHYQIREEAKTSKASVIAVEVKMRRWREALEQARSYMKFADQAFVLLDGNQVQVSESVADAFREAGVGLLLQYGGVLHLEIPASSVSSFSADRVQAIQKLAAARAT